MWTVAQVEAGAQAQVPAVVLSVPQAERGPGFLGAMLPPAVPLLFSEAVGLPSHGLSTAH